jgi:hypothetical protein
MSLDKKFGEDLLHKLQDEKIHPKPKWQFRLKNYSIWGVGAFSLFLGATSVSLIVFMLANSDWDVYGRIDHEPFELFLLVPFFWIICLSILTFLVYYDVKHTKKGYRYSPILIISGVVGTSIFFGVIFHVAGVGKKVDDVMGRNVPYYDKVVNPNVNFWSQPERGRLSGMVIMQIKENDYVLVDREKGEWEILTEEVEQAPSFKLEIGQPTRLLGKALPEHKFTVVEILPMPQGRGFFMRFDTEPNRMHATDTKIFNNQVECINADVCPMNNK